MLIQCGYSFTLTNGSISYKLSQSDNLQLDKDAITTALKQLKANKRYATAYLKSLLTMRVILASVMPIEYILLLIEIFDYKKQEQESDIKLFETQEKLDEYIHQTYFVSDSYEVIHSLTKNSTLYLKVYDKKRYALHQSEFTFDGDWRELTPEEMANCPWPDMKKIKDTQQTLADMK